MVGYVYLEITTKFVPTFCYGVKFRVCKIIFKLWLSLVDLQKTLETLQFQGDTVYISGETTSKNGLLFVFSSKAGFKGGPRGPPWAPGPYF